MGTQAEAPDGPGHGGTGFGVRGDMEEECRVCRGEAEEGRPLFSPCLCSGSIRMTHQDCLLQWLQHSGKDSCELCKHKFQFKPVYAPDAPRHVPPQHVFRRCLRKAVAEWIPFMLRLVLASVLWLGVVPCTTSWIYRIWIHRRTLLLPEVLKSRLTWHNLWSDCLSGIIIATIVIFSFLSLMSFADFLRFHWDAREAENAAVEEDEQAAMIPPQAGGQPEGPPVRQDTNTEELKEEDVDAGQVAAGTDEQQQQQHAPVVHPEPAQAARAAQPPPPVGMLPALGGHGRGRGGGDDGDMVEVEVAIAVDEVMGLRGPFPFLLRNILWLTAFNAAYLGLFCFVPYSVGAAVVGAAERYADNPVVWMFGLLVPASVRKLAMEISVRAAEQDQTLQLPDLSIILLGYCVMSAMVFCWRAVVCAVCQRAPLPMLSKVVKVLRSTAAVVKVGLLLFMKMLLLPLLLGLWLDAATAEVIGSDREGRVWFAVENLVGALLLHWVAGITFMLFVTVAVLQLREVLHPDLLSKIIRPQEPHPDLLGSLLQESGLAHARRMGMSLSIYVLLLIVFVWLPIKVLRTAYPDMGRLELRTFLHFAPQLQVPCEAILFHLALLSFLERAKNVIGHFEYVWLRGLCRLLGLTRFLLPVARLPVGDMDMGRVEVDRSSGQTYVAAHQPVRRPPPLWEETDIMQRWAWGSEPPSELEKTLAPRRRPAFVGLRMGVLVTLSWAATLVVVAGGFALPLVLGRGCFDLMHLPPEFHHDPLAYAAGVGLCWVVKTAGVWLHRQLSVAGVREWARRASSPPLRAIGHLSLLLVLWLLVCPLLIGTLFEVTLVVPSTQWEKHGVGALKLGQDLLLGLVVLNGWAALAVAGLVEGLWPVIHPDAPRQRPNRSQAVVKDTLRSLRSVLVEWDWGQATFANLLAPLIWPMASRLLMLVVTAPISARCLAVLSSKMAVLPVWGTERELQLLCVRAWLLWWLPAWGAQRLAHPARLWLKSMHDAVRDEKYLLGVELQDYKPTSRGRSAEMS